MDKTFSQILDLGVLHARWRLINACDLPIPGVCDAAADNNCVYMRDRVIRMAERILEKPRPYYAISICGGEPTLHPFLPDITRYLLGTSRKVGLTIETDGSREPAWYDELLRGLTPASLRLLLLAHPGGDAAALGRIAALAFQHGQLARIRMFHDQAAPLNNDFFQSLLRHIPADLPVTWESGTLPGFCDGREIPAPGAPQSLKWLTGIYNIEASARVTPPPQGAERYCCQGTNFLYIAPDGHYYGAQCPMTCSQLPLWHDDARLEVARIFRCRLPQCPGGLNNLLPKFARPEDAREYFGQYEARGEDWEWEIPPLFSGSWQKPGPERKIWLRLARLKSLTENDAQISACPDLLRGQRENIAAVCRRLENDASQEIFLRVLRALQKGDSGFLPAESARPANAGLELAAEDIEAFLPAAAAEMPDLNITLPLDGAAFLERLLLAEASLADYKLGLAFFDGAPHLLARAMPRPWKAGELRATEKSVSVIIACRNAQDSVGATIDSILVQNFQDFEIIVVDGGSDDATLSVINQRKAGEKNLRVVRAAADIALPKLLQIGLNEAKGKFVHFLAPGDIIPAGFFDSVKSMLANNEETVIVADTMLVGPQKEELAWVASQGEISPAAAFMQAWANGYALSACLVKREYLRAHKIYPAAARGDFELWLGTHIFASLDKIAAAPQLGVIRAQGAGERPGQNALARLADCLVALDSLAEKFRIDAAIKSQCAERILDKYLPEALARINEDGQPDPASMKILARNRLFVDSFLARASASFCERQNWRPVAAEADREKAETEIAAPKIAAYGDAVPALKRGISIILYNRDGGAGAEKALDSILGQSMRDYEIIAVDDASGDGSREALRDYIDAGCPSLRLYELDAEAGRGFCLDYAFGLANGDYCLFMDSGQTLRPDYLANVRANNGGAELLLYSSQNVLPDDEVSWRNTLVDESVSARKAWRLYEKGRIRGRSAAIVYKTAFARAAGCGFGPGVHEAEDYFLVEALASAQKIASFAFVASSNHVKHDFSLELPPLNYSQIYSALRLRNFVRKKHGAGDLSGPGGALFKSRLFAPIAALSQANGEIPFKAEDYEIFGKTPDLLAELLVDYGRETAGELARPAGPVAAPADYAPKPLTSVIWKGAAADLAGFMPRFMAELARDLELLAPEAGRNEEIADARVIWTKEPALAEARGEFALFADYGSGFEPGDILRATAILSRNPGLDLVCFCEPAPFYGAPEPGEYDGLEALALHTNAKTAPLRWQTCVFRKSFLDKNGVVFGEGAQAGEVFLLTALQKANSLQLLAPEKPHDRRPRFRPGPDALAVYRAIADAIAGPLAKTSGLDPNARSNLLAKFMRESNLAPLVGREYDELETL